MVSVEQGSEGQRIDNFLLRELKGAPRSYIYRILRKGEVRVNRGRVKADYRLKLGDQVRIPPVRLAASPAPPRFSREQRERLERSILFEDERIMVINKPAGMAVHGGSGLSFGVIEALRALRPEERSLELVHRLDRDTSGCLLLSKRRSALRSLHELMQKNLVDKRYLALLAGSWRKGRQEVDAPLLKNTLKGGERVVIVDAAGKPSLTRFTRVRRFKQATLVEAELVTGRTHQIRVHSAWLGSPILGDTRYGDEIANRQLRQLGLKRLFLHAHSIKFRWPGEKRDQEFKAPLPDVLEAVLNELDK
ncbi:ribosomal large subunit pseudouridine synthase C [endosymbiont of Ridgeia piscesae]|jgi:23S rRNA pseudouridine955/2504/2580 synthase|uniref:Pseudouridine synthase n=3 Tax=endosymbiont of Ridgeia piscesae TaxID=54398 RepID=A0A0T5YZM9_9GAMM|nr:ribosomal large subunit pseudouridine synthase C [endosymbiont of Ridgeia piscesae]